MNRKYKIIISLLFLFCIIGIIYYNSSQIGSKSFKMSSSLIKVFRVLLNPIIRNFSDKELLIFIRKLAHIFEFSLLFLVLYLVLKNFLKKPIVYYTTVFICISIALLDEYHQTYVRGRIGSISDVVVDLIGIYIMLFLVILYEEIMRRKKLKYEVKYVD